MFLEYFVIAVWRGRFSNMAFLYLYMVPFHAAIVICLVKDFLFKSILTLCVLVLEEFTNFCFLMTKANQFVFEKKILTLSSKGGLQDVWKKFIDSFDYRIQYNYLEYKSVDKLNAISSLFPSHCEKIFSEYCIICYISCRHLFLQQFEIF